MTVLARGTTEIKLVEDGSPGGTAALADARTLPPQALADWLAGRVK